MNWDGKGPVVGRKAPEQPEKDVHVEPPAKRARASSGSGSGKGMGKRSGSGAWQQDSTLSGGITESKGISPTSSSRSPRPGPARSGSRANSVTSANNASAGPDPTSEPGLGLVTPVTSPIRRATKSPSSAGLMLALIDSATKVPYTSRYNQADLKLPLLCQSTNTTRYTQMGSYLFPQPKEPKDDGGSARSSALALREEE